MILSRTPEYRAWDNMIARCERPSADRFKDYGGRGITVCSRWRHSFSTFLEDLGPKPSRLHSLDRIDTNGNYEPVNCRWATRGEQYISRRSTVMVEWGGERLPLLHAIASSGKSIHSYYRRRRKGLSPQAAFDVI